MTLYSLELMSLPEENPILIEKLHNAGFSVNRTGNSFSRVGVDMALEQTINAKAKTRLKDIMLMQMLLLPSRGGLLQTL